MSESKKGSGTTPKSASSTNKFRRPTTASSTSLLAPSTASKIKRNTQIQPKTNKNKTVIGDVNTTTVEEELTMAEYDEGMRQMAYGKFMRAMLQDCLVSEKIQREETEIDIQLSLLAQRFEKTINELDKTNRRLKDVSFAVEQKRLYNLKNKECAKFFDMIQNSKANDVVDNILKKEEQALDRLETKNVDFGFNEQSGHQQLLDIVNDAITGLEDIKKHSDLDPSKFKMHEAANKKLIQLESDQQDIDLMKQDFEKRFPKYSEQLLKEASEKITEMMDNVVKDNGDDSSSSSD